MVIDTATCKLFFIQEVASFEIIYIKYVVTYRDNLAFSSIKITGIKVIKKNRASTN